VTIKGKATEKSTIFFRTYTLAADMAAIPLRKSEAETAMDVEKFRRTKRGEKISPPPRPIMVRMREEKKIITRSKMRFIVVLSPAFGKRV